MAFMQLQEIEELNNLIGGYGRSDTQLNGVYEKLGRGKLFPEDIDKNYEMDFKNNVEQALFENLSPKDYGINNIDEIIPYDNFYKYFAKPYELLSIAKVLKDEPEESKRFEEIYKKYEKQYECLTTIRLQIKILPV